MSEQKTTYNWRADSIGCYDLWIAYRRELGVRRNEFAPRTPRELQQNMIGMVPVDQFDCMKSRTPPKRG